MTTVATSGCLTTLAFGMPGGTEWIILLILGLLIFGRRLPEVGRSLGRGIVEFKRGVKGIEDEIDDASTTVTRKLDDADRPALSEGGPGASESDSIPRAKVAGEAVNPYAPDDAGGK